MGKMKKGADFRPKSKTGFYATNEKNEDKKVRIALMAYQPCTRRRLSELTKLEIPTLCRVLYNSVYHEQHIKISHYGKCPKTKMNVMHFTLSDWKAATEN